MKTLFAIFAVAPMTAMLAFGQSTSAPKAAAAKAPSTQASANLGQLMKGILFPASNVLFAAQGQDPAQVPQAKDPSLATDPLTSTYGKWEAVENSALAIAEASRLLLVPGRKCANGVAVPVANADWVKYVRELRQVGMDIYKIAQMKDQDKMVDASDGLTMACANCHDKYREKPNLADRCK